MKKSSIMLAVLVTGFLTFGFNQFCSAQNNGTPPTNKIEVVGSSEMEVIPDEIYINISLREYMKDGKNKVQIEVLEKELQAAVNKAGIPRENFEIENVYGYNWQWGKKRSEDFLAGKRYRLKLADLNAVNRILSGVDQKGIEHVNIGEYTHSKLEQYKMELKAKALVAAKDKADYLLKSIGEEAGKVLEIQEMHDSYVQPYYDMRSMKAESMDMAAPEIEFRKIKLRYEMKASFAIK